jgi:transposase
MRAGIFVNVTPELAPHRVRTFNCPAFAEKLRNIVGLYVDPPDHAVVLSVDEKSQIQALDRTQPGLPMKPGRAGTMTHDYKRHGTTTLFAALNVLDGSVIGRNMRRHRHQEFIRFLNTIEAEVPKRKAIHAIVDNYATHEHPKVRQWLARHPRWNPLHTDLGILAQRSRRLLRQAYQPTPQAWRLPIRLRSPSRHRFLEETNSDPKPFVWTADPDRVLAAVKRGKEKLESIH